VDRIKASGRVRPRYQAGHMTAPSRIEINQIALDPCGPSTHDNAYGGIPDLCALVPLACRLAGEAVPFQTEHGRKRGPMRRKRRPRPHLR
jgi:hypothetical protein